MSLQPDIVIQDRSGKPIAVIEVKRTAQMSAHWAAEYFNLYREAGLLEDARYFLLVTPQAVYFWDRQGQAMPRELANREAIVPKYLAERVTSDRYDARTFEYAVLQWLLDFSEHDERHHDEAEEMLRDAGFLAALKQGQLRFGAPA